MVEKVNLIKVHCKHSKCHNKPPTPYNMLIKIIKIKKTTKKPKMWSTNNFK
jgi:hypothetical protein